MADRRVAVLARWPPVSGLELQNSWPRDKSDWVASSAEGPFSSGLSGMDISKSPFVALVSTAARGLGVGWWNMWRVIREPRGFSFQATRTSASSP